MNEEKYRIGKPRGELSRPTTRPETRARYTVSIMNYGCMEFKPFYKNNHDAEAHRLQELEEARGQLLRVFEAEGQAVATFAWGTVSFPGEMIDVLREMVGKMVCVLRLDGKYHLRAVDDA